MEVHNIKCAMANNYYSMNSVDSLNFYSYYFRTCTHCRFSNVNIHQ